MFASWRPRDLSAHEVHDALEANRIVLIDVREPAEFAAERISGAFNVPLSTFDPALLPETLGRRVVFQCGSGMRSAKAAERCRNAGVSADAHLAGGISAWKRAGFPVVGVARGR